MKDSIIIWKYISREYPDSHQCVFVYVSGNPRGKKLAISQIVKSIEPVFSGVMSEYLMKTVAKAYLEDKLNGYKKGLVKIKSVY